MFRLLAPTLLMGLLLAVAACTFYSNRTARDLHETVKGPKTAIADQWLGKWIGPEGTFLVISRSADKCTIQIQSLDGPNVPTKEDFTGTRSSLSATERPNRSARAPAKTPA